MKRYYLFLLGLFFSCSTWAQSVEIGAFVGASTYAGDLSARIITPKETKLSTGLYVHLPVSNYLAFRIGGYYGSVSGSDANAPEPTTQRRNLSFKSTITEANAQVLLYLLGSATKFQPYFFGGLGVFRFNPKALYMDEWVELQPLGTEGQGITGKPDKYSLTQFMIPVGAGIKFTTRSRWNFGLDIGYRKTFTDYLDDVSTAYFNEDELLANNGELAVALADRSGELNDTGNLFTEGEARGNARYLDGYLFTGITISYSIREKHFEKKQQYGCYKF